jgi:hypothetical protein
MVPVQTIRRLSEPSTASSEDGKRSSSPGSISCGSTTVEKTLETKKGRKYSLEMPVPKIEINTEKIASDANVTPNPCMKYLSPMTINASSDRTISESNLSTSGYSSLSSPGISRYSSKFIAFIIYLFFHLKLFRCNSSSPFPEEIGGVNAELTTIVIPDVPLNEFEHKLDNKSSYGNFLTIPIFTFSVKEQTHETNRTQQTIVPTTFKPKIICPQIKISAADSFDNICNTIPVDEGIDVDVEAFQKV